jgi:hypothetical protein
MHPGARATTFAVARALAVMVALDVMSPCLPRSSLSAAERNSSRSTPAKSPVEVPDAGLDRVRL